MPVEEILFEAEEKMEKAVDVLRGEYRGLRTGRASAGLVDSIRVEYYGSMTPLKQMASIGTPEANLIVIKPFDPTVIGDIDRAIQASELGIMPTNDGKLIRLVVPPLSTERRQQLGARVKELAEEARVALRNIRREANKNLDKEQKDKLLTEDERDRAKDDVQELIKDYEGKVDELVEKKSEEILEI